MPPEVWKLPHVGARKLKGMDGSVSPVEYLNMIREIINVLLAEQPLRMGWSAAQVADIKDAFESISAYKKKVFDKSQNKTQRKYNKHVFALRLNGCD